MKQEEHMNEFIRAMLIRAARTICQTAVATIGSAAVLADVDWKIVLSAAALSGILSILTSIATGLPEVHSADEMTEEEVENAEHVLIADADIDEEEDDEESEL